MRQLSDSLAGVCRLLELAPSAAVGATIDFSNLIFAGESLPAVIDALGTRMYNTHIKNGTIGADGSWHFHALDRGLTDYAEVLALLRNMHYTGYLTIECLGPAAREQPVATARRDLDLLRSYMAS